MNAAMALNLLDATDDVLSEVHAHVLSVVRSARWSFSGWIVNDLDALVQHINRCVVKCDYLARGARAGSADRRRNWITLNMNLLTTPERLRSTALHEWAHIIQFAIAPTSKPHGPEWKRIARMLGHSGERCHDYDIAAAYPERYVRYVCACRQVPVSKRTHNKILAGTKYSCNKCHSYLTKV